MGRLDGGFTLVELMVVVVLLSILLVIGVPSYQGITTSNRITAEINGLVTHLQYARSVAVKQGETVIVTSNSGANWANGWTVTVVGSGALLKQQQAFTGSDTLIATVPSITYDGNGFTPNATTLTLHDQANTVDYRRCVVVSAGGQLTPNKQGACP